MKKAVIVLQVVVLCAMSFLLSGCSKATDTAVQNDISQSNAPPSEISQEEALQDNLSVNDTSESDMNQDDIQTGESIIEESIIEESVMEESIPEEKQAVVFYDAGEIVRTGIKIADGLLYYGDLSGKFAAIDLKTSEPEWEYMAENSVETDPVLYNDCILFNAANSLYCLDAQTGTEKFVYKNTGSDVDKRVSESGFSYGDSWVAVIDDIAYYASLDGSIVAVDIATGQSPWSFPPVAKGNVTSGINAYDNKLYYIDAHGALCCLDPVIKELVFRNEIAEHAYEPLCIDDGIVYVGGRNYTQYAIDAETGNLVWSKVIGSWVSGGAVVVGNTLYTGSSDERMVYAFDKRDGTILNKFKVQYQVYTLPVVYQNSMIILSTLVYTREEACLQSINMETGAVSFFVPFKTSLLSTPAIYEDTIYFGADNGEIYAVELK